MLNEVAIKRAKSCAAEYASQGLGPRQSVLPLLISFLFSHIVLAVFSIPSPFPASPLPAPAPPLFLLLSPLVLSLSSSPHPQAPLFLFLFRFPITISPGVLSVALFISALPYLNTVGIRACDSHREREEVLSLVLQPPFSAFGS